MTSIIVHVKLIDDRSDIVWIRLHSTSDGALYVAIHLVHSLYVTTKLKTVMSPLASSQHSALMSYRNRHRADAFVMGLDGSNNVVS